MDKVIMRQIAADLEFIKLNGGQALYEHVEKKDVVPHLLKALKAVKAYRKGIEETMAERAQRTRDITEKVHL